MSLGGLDGPFRAWNHGGEVRGEEEGCQAARASAADTLGAVIAGLSGRKRWTRRAHKCTSAVKGSLSFIQDGHLCVGL